MDSLTLRLTRRARALVKKNDYSEDVDPELSHRLRSTTSFEYGALRIERRLKALIKRDFCAEGNVYAENLARLNSGSSPDLATKEHIRLVKVLDHHNGLLVCRLEVFELSQAPVYGAMSYSWGVEPACVEILLQTETTQQRKLVTQDVKCALVRLDKINEFGWLWLDQICIDQADNDEKSDQVGRMYSIYSRAQCVFIWLGEDLPERRRLRRSPKAQGAILSLAKVEQLTRQDDRVWWRRLWVWQEFLACKDRRVCIGPRVLTWDRFYSALHQTYQDMVIHPRSFFRQSDDYNFKISLDKFERFRTSWSLDQRRSLSWCLYHTTNCSTSDPHDRIYALMGMASQADRRAVRVDYNVGLPVLFQAVVEYLIKCLTSMDVIFQFHTPRGKGVHPTGCGSYRPGTENDVPTWVPDFSKLGSIVEDPESQFNEHIGSGYLSLGRRYQSPDMRVEGQLLQIRVVAVDRIRQVCNGPEEQVLSAAQNFLQAIRSDRYLSSDSSRTDPKNGASGGRLVGIAVDAFEGADSEFGTGWCIPTGDGLNLFALTSSHDRRDEMREGDEVVAVFGASLPWVLRDSGLLRSDGQKLWDLIGMIRLGGLREGQMIDLLESGGVESKMVWLR